MVLLQTVEVVETTETPVAEVAQMLEVELTLDMECLILRMLHFGI